MRMVVSLTELKQRKKARKSTSLPSNDQVQPRNKHHRNTGCLTILSDSRSSRDNKAKIEVTNPSVLSNPFRLNRSVEDKKQKNAWEVLAPAIETSIACSELGFLGIHSSSDEEENGALCGEITDSWDSGNKDDEEFGDFFDENSCQNSPIHDSHCLGINTHNKRSLIERSSPDIQKHKPFVSTQNSASSKRKKILADNSRNLVTGFGTINHDRLEHRSVLHETALDSCDSIDYNFAIKAIFSSKVRFPGWLTAAAGDNVTKDQFKIFQDSQLGSDDMTADAVTSLLKSYYYSTACKTLAFSNPDESSEWLRAFKSLCSGLLGFRIPYFYFNHQEFNVLFYSNEENDNISAVMYPASRFLLESLMRGGSMMEYYCESGCLIASKSSNISTNERFNFQQNSKQLDSNSYKVIFKQDCIQVLMEFLMSISRNPKKSFFNRSIANNLPHLISPKSFENCSIQFARLSGPSLVKRIQQKTLALEMVNEVRVEGIVLPHAMEKICKWLRESDWASGKEEESFELKLVHYSKNLSVKPHEISI